MEAILVTGLHNDPPDSFCLCRRFLRVVRHKAAKPDLVKMMPYTALDAP